MFIYRLARLALGQSFNTCHVTSSTVLTLWQSFNVCVRSLVALETGGTLFKALIMSLKRKPELTLFTIMSYHWKFGRLVSLTWHHVNVLHHWQVVAEWRLHLQVRKEYNWNSCPHRYNIQADSPHTALPRPSLVSDLQHNPDTRFDPHWMSGPAEVSLYYYTEIIQQMHALFIYFDMLNSIFCLA